MVSTLEQGQAALPLLTARKSKSTVFSKSLPGTGSFLPKNSFQRDSVALTEVPLVISLLIFRM